MVVCLLSSINTSGFLPPSEGFGDVQRVGHRRSCQHVHGQPVLLHGQSLVRGDLEPGSGTRGCEQPADMAAQHRGEDQIICHIHATKTAVFGIKSGVKPLISTLTTCGR